ncbi:MAG: nickel/cobalt transporter [Pseudomonadota bacterium]
MRGGLITIAALLVLGGSTAFAQSPLGIGAAEPAIIPTNTGPFAGFFAWVAAQQREFYRLLTAALTDMRDNPAAAWGLVWLSFLYGILHAAGPGHGKVVISSYMLANEIELRRGIMLSFAASVVQSLSAIAIIGLGFLILRQLSISMTDTTRGLEIASYGLVVLLGLWLVYEKGQKLLPQKPLASLSAAAVPVHSHGFSCDDDDYAHDHDASCGCGHAHMPAPEVTSGTLRELVATVLSVGLRPCTGALIVLTFAFVNELWVAGIASTLAMSVGTAITVSMLASLAVGAKGLALKFSGAGNLNRGLLHTIEIGGALLVLFFGVVLLTGALSG